METTENESCKVIGSRKKTYVLAPRAYTTCSPITFVHDKILDTVVCTTPIATVVAEVSKLLSAYTFKGPCSTPLSDANAEILASIPLLRTSHIALMCSILWGDEPLIGVALRSIEQAAEEYDENQTKKAAAAPSKVVADVAGDKGEGDEDQNPLVPLTAGCYNLYCACLVGRPHIMRSIISAWTITPSDIVGFSSRAIPLAAASNGHVDCFKPLSLVPCSLIPCIPIAVFAGRGNVLRHLRTLMSNVPFLLFVKDEETIESYNTAMGRDDIYHLVVKLSCPMSKAELLDEKEDDPRLTSLDLAEELDLYDQIANDPDCTSESDDDDEKEKEGGDPADTSEYESEGDSEMPLKKRCMFIDDEAEEDPDPEPEPAGKGDKRKAIADLKNKRKKKTEEEEPSPTPTSLRESLARMERRFLPPPK